MILNYKTFGKQNKGSSLTFSASGGSGQGQGKDKIPAKNFASPSEGEAEGGGNSASPELKRSPAALLVQSRTRQKSFLFLLPARRSLGAGGEEKIGRAQNQKCRENFFAGWRALASGGGAVYIKNSSNGILSSPACGGLGSGGAKMSGSAEHINNFKFFLAEYKFERAKHAQMFFQI